MKKITLLKELEKYPIFNVKIISELIKKRKTYAKLIIFRLKKEGLIFEIERNKYTVYKDPILIASQITWPSYISIWTALKFYNMTEQLPQTIFVITTRHRRRKINFLNNAILFIRVNPKYFFGYSKKTYGDSIIFMANKEKTLIDSVLFKKISFSEISEIIKYNLKDIDFNKLNKYLLKIENKTIIKRFGWLLDRLGIDYYSKFEKYIDNKYIGLDYAMPLKGSKNKKWKVIENVRL